MLVIDAAMVSNTLGHDFWQNFAVLPAQGTRGGVLLLLACSQSHYAMSQVDIREFSVTATITNLVAQLSMDGNRGVRPAGGGGQAAVPARDAANQTNCCGRLDGSSWATSI
jgi:hypothetical protein